MLNNIKHFFNTKFAEEVINNTKKVLIAIIILQLSFLFYLFVKPLYWDGPYLKLNYFMIFLNIISVMYINYIINIKIKPIKFFTTLIFSTFIVFEISSLYFLGNDIDATFLMNILDFEFIKAGLKTRPFLSVLAVILFLSIIIINSLTSKIPQIKSKIIKYLLAFVLVFYLFTPFGFIYRIASISDFSYIKDKFLYRNHTYNDIFKTIKNTNYITRKDLISKIKGNKKNIVIIYLESFEQEYLYNDYLSKYTPFLKELSEKNEFHYNLKQLKHSNYTLSAMFATMCGIEFNLYVTNPYMLEDGEKRIVCMPNVLKNAGYKQVFIGGAEGRLFHKQVLFNDIFEYNEFYDRTSIKELYNNSLKLSRWGIYDEDMFNFAKKKYVELSKKKEPFNLTLLTLATHNPDGVFDRRCKNTDKITLAQGVECTDNLIEDFINFIKKQPNYKDTLIVILPDHIQYNENGLKKIIDSNKRLLYTIIINSDDKNKHNNDILYTDMPELVIDKLNIETNAIFFNSDLKNKNIDSKLKQIEKNTKISKVFLYKLFKK